MTIMLGLKKGYIARNIRQFLLYLVLKLKKDHIVRNIRQFFIYLVVILSFEHQAYGVLIFVKVRTKIILLKNITYVLSNFLHVITIPRIN